MGFSNGISMPSCEIVVIDPDGIRLVRVPYMKFPGLPWARSWQGDWFKFRFDPRRLPL